MIGKHRSKAWDVVLNYARRPQLAVSTKSIMSNASGTIANRVDDALGECVNVHTYDPGMVLGYLAIMDRRQARKKTRGNRRLGDILAESLHGLSGRRSPEDTPELFEAATLVLVDFASKPPAFEFHPDLLDWPAFFELLVNHVRVRNPLIDRAMTSGDGEAIGEARGQNPEARANECTAEDRNRL